MFLGFKVGLYRFVGVKGVVVVSFSVFVVGGTVRVTFRDSVGGVVGANVRVIGIRGISVVLEVLYVGASCSGVAVLEALECCCCLWRYVSCGFSCVWRC